VREEGRGKGGERFGRRTRGGLSGNEEREKEEKKTGRERETPRAKERKT